MNKYINIEELLQTCTRFSTEEVGIVLVCHDDEHGVIDVCAKPENDNEYVIEWARYCDGMDRDNDRWYEIPYLAGQVFPASVFTELVKRFTPRTVFNNFFLPRDIAMHRALKGDALYVAIEAAEGDYVRFTVKLETKFSEEQRRNDWRGDLWQLAYYRIRFEIGAHGELLESESCRGIEFKAENDHGHVEISPDDFLTILRKWGNGNNKEKVADSLIQTINNYDADCLYWEETGLQYYMPPEEADTASRELSLMFPEWMNRLEYR